MTQESSSAEQPSVVWLDWEDPESECCGSSDSDWDSEEDDWDSELDWGRYYTSDEEGHLAQRRMPALNSEDVTDVDE